MKRFFVLSFFLLFLLFSANEIFAYLNPSLRIRALGDEFVGVIDDNYTDIYRNPAYLSYVKRIKIFGQYNNYYKAPVFILRKTEIDYAPIGIPEYKLGKENATRIKLRSSSSQQANIQGYFHNKKTVLGGLVLPIFNYGSLSLVGELKPDEKNTHDSYQQRYLYADYYQDHTYFSKSSTKRTISNFKAIYGIKISRQLRVGLDYTYLKNYDFYEYHSESENIRRYIDTDSLKSINFSKSDRYTDNSPDLHRGSIGFILIPKSSTRLDLTLHYESISYNDTSHNWSEYKYTYYYGDTPSRYSGSENQYKRNYKHKIKSWGADINIKYSPNYRSTLTFLVSGRFQENNIAGYRDDFRSIWSSIDTLEREKSSGYFWPSENRDEILSFLVGGGLEHNFRPSIKFAIALKGYWDRVKVRREEKETNFIQETINDSLIYSHTAQWEKSVRVTNDNYRVVLQICVEAKFHKMVKGRLGGMVVYQDTKYLDRSSSKSMKAHYSLGLGFSYKRKIYMDVFAQDDITEIKSWMVNIGYNF